VSADTSKAFYQKWNSMAKSDQEAWLKEAPDDNAKTIAAQINKERSKGLDEIKPSNELSKLYSEFDKDMSTHPEYTEVDKRNKAKKFQADAYKLNFNTDHLADLYETTLIKMLLGTIYIFVNPLNVSINITFLAVDSIKRSCSFAASEL
jgi:hypothetical protein